MKIMVKKWGNSLGIRLPKSFATESGIKENAPVEMQLIDGRIIIQPAKEERSLEELLVEVSSKNLHEEVLHDTRGAESW